jgi:hypothetical protein
MLAEQISWGGDICRHLLMSINAGIDSELARWPIFTKLGESGRP